MTFPPATTSRLFHRVREVLGSGRTERLGLTHRVAGADEHAARASLGYSAPRRIEVAPISPPLTAAVPAPSTTRAPQLSSAGRAREEQVFGDGDLTG